MRKWIYNLEFPSWCPSLTIADYQFYRVDDYPEKVTRLQHLVTSYSEFKITANTGEHAITAYVEIPPHEENAVLEWGGSNATALHDVLFLLSIFTGRDVFSVDELSEKDTDSFIIADHRVYHWGGVLICSIPYKEKPIEHHHEPIGYNIGFEEGLNQIYELIRSKQWQHKYQGGYYLFLARMAFHPQYLESAFIQCWTIWEHLFAVLNGNWLSKKQIHRMHAVDKIAFLLVEYALTDEIDTYSHAKIESLAEIRNRLVHYGRFPERSTAHDDAVLFIRLTEFVIAKTLGLLPSNLFNTMEKLEGFLNKNH